MPHDKFGKPLAAGDRVIVRAIVHNVDPHDDYCNVRLETEEPMYPGEAISTVYLNARQLEKQEPAAIDDGGGEVIVESPIG